MGNFPEHIQFYSVEFIPLIILTFEICLKRRNNWITFSFFTLLIFQFLACVDYSAYLMVVLPIYIFIRIFQQKIQIKQFINTGFIFGIIIFTIVCGLVGYKYYQVSVEYGKNRDISSDEVSLSAWVSDWIVTGNRNYLYGNVRTQLQNSFPTYFNPSINIPEYLFWGITPIMLFLASFYYVRKTKFKYIWITSLVVLVTSFILSFGPHGPYILLKLVDPLLKYIRSPILFAVFVFFSLAIICTLTIEILSKRVSNYKLISLVIIIFLVIEYWNKPIQNLYIPPETQNFYKAVNNQKNIKVIAELPIGQAGVYTSNQVVISPDVDAKYLLWATIYHNKVLINGFNSLIPDLYAERVNSFLLAPTILKISSLKKWGAEGLIIERDQFSNPSEFDYLKKDLERFKVPILISTDNFVLYDLRK